MNVELQAPANGSRIRCVVVQDQVLVLELLCEALRNLRGLEIVATGTSLADGDRLEASRAIDLLILDCVLGDGSGFDLLRRLVAMHPGLRCIVITDSAPTNACPPDLADWIVATVGQAEPLAALLAAIEEAVGERVAKPAGSPNGEPVRARLTKREGDVFVHLGRGLANKEIATALGISVRTVETHRKAIAKKLGCNGASLVRLATLATHR